MTSKRVARGGAMAFEEIKCKGGMGMLLVGFLPNLHAVFKHLLICNDITTKSNCSFQAICQSL